MDLSKQFNKILFFIIKKCWLKEFFFSIYFYFFYNNYLDTKLDNKNNTLTCKILFFLKYNKNVKFSLPLANKKKCTLVNFFARLNFQFLFAISICIEIFVIFRKKKIVCPAYQFMIHLWCNRINTKESIYRQKKT